jgi:hypothetical protein
MSRWAGETVFMFGALPPMAILALGLCALAFWTDIERRLRFGWAFLTVVLYAGGYMLNYSLDSRYYLPTIPVLMIAVYILLEYAMHRLLAQWPSMKGLGVRWSRPLLLAAPIVSFAWLGPLMGELHHPGNPCLRQDSQAIAGLLLPPTASTDDLINRIAYFTRVKTLGVVPFATPPSQADALLREMHVRTLLAPPDSDLATALRDLYGYPWVGEARVCGSSYAVLRVPDG